MTSTAHLHSAVAQPILAVLCTSDGVLRPSRWGTACLPRASRGRARLGVEPFDFQLSTLALRAAEGLSTRFDSTAASTYNPARIQGMQHNPIQQVGDNAMKKCFWIFAAAFFLCAGQATRLAAQAPDREASRARSQSTGQVRRRRNQRRIFRNRSHHKNRQPNDSVQSHRQHHAPQERQGRRNRPALLRRLHAQRREGSHHAPRLLPLQRWPRLRHHVAAHGRFRPAPRLDRRRHVHSSRSLQARRQRRKPSRQNRSRFHRRDGHRLQSRRLQSARKKISTVSTKTSKPSRNSSSPISAATTAGTRRNS